MNLEIRTFYNRIAAHGCIHSITKPTRVTSKTVSLIDNILTNFIFDTLLKLKKGILKSDVSDHFSVVVSLCFPSFIHKEYQKITIHKRVMHNTNLMAFKADLRNVNWNSINHSPEKNLKYETFDIKNYENVIWAIRKTLSPKGFLNQSKGLPGTMDKQSIDKIRLSKNKKCIFN